MQSRNDIIINYEKAIRQANKLEELAEALSGQSKQLEEKGREISAVWSGEAGEAFYQKTIRMVDKTKKNSRNLSDAAAALRKSAKRTRDADLMALQILSIGH